MWKTSQQNTETDDEKEKRMSLQKGMLRPWNPTKSEIKSWLKTKELEFAQKDNINPRATPRKYLEKYVFIDLHEVLFYEFPHLLQECILNLKENHAKTWILQLEWNSVQIAQLQQVNNKFTRVVDFLLNSQNRGQSISSML